MDIRQTMDGSMFTGCRGLAVMVVALVVASCSPPPDKRVIEVCRNTAVREALGHQLSNSDIGELVEECMASKGFELNENGKVCSSDLATATRPTCYYRKNFFGWLSQKIS